MIDYFEALSVDEQEKVSSTIRTLYKQTFLLERKYDKKTKRYSLNPEYNECTKHLDFLKAYFRIMDIDVVESTSAGVIYIRGEQTVGEKLPKLATLYILVLKLIFDEQMETASNFVNAVTSLGEMHEKLAAYRLLKKQPSVTEIRRALALLRKYQIIESLDMLDDLDGPVRMVIYPTVHVVLMGDDVRALIDTYTEGDEEDDESEI